MEIRRATGMTCLITGASGFIGSWLAEALTASGVPVVAQMRGAPSALFTRLVAERDITIHSDADIAAAIGKHQPTTVFHLAGMSQIAQANQNPVLAYEANARAAWTMLDALRRMPEPARCVIASTDSLYGETGGKAAVEGDPVHATGPYETSKHMAELAARSFAAIYGMPVTIARLGNVYGPGDANGARIIPSVLAALSAGSVPQLRGGGRAVRSLLHVQDCISGLRMLADAADRPDVRGEAFNLSGTPAFTTAEIARFALDAFGQPDAQPTITDDAPGETSVKFSDSSKLQERLGWMPEWTLEAGLRDIRETWESFR
ncbi:NAD(P)-dependent oxidoreductase [Pseudorhodobacter sp.]|uniref:NAD-dependent epimerase/dehydratase family protein n=1 Tax=Pseudorhodobacter sp. TaxID=1934400 RepID=UPI0026498D2E|nr:NAD(P)-dependent oxidoreductase [Pseudorhodobacter sp.]MDN5785905.1 NAD(P)-dependent oxidoreductase [Pseudorhodobacter sp.]